MDFRVKGGRGKPEKEGALRLRKEMERHGWHVHRLNVSTGNYSTPGFPDFYCTHLRFGVRWIETKIEGGRLESSQVERFKQFAEHNIGVWILTDERDYQKLFEQPNWWQLCWQGMIR